MTNEVCRESLYQDYIATAVKVIAESYARVHGGELKLPSFIEMTHTSKGFTETPKQVIERLKKAFSGKED